MQTAKVDVPTESAQATSVLSTSIKRFTNQVDFYESQQMPRPAPGVPLAGAS